MEEFELVRKDIIKLNLSVKELIQRVQDCHGPLEDLNELNLEGRKKISLIRSNLATLKTIAHEEEKPGNRKWLLEDVTKTEEELTSTIAAFRKANIAALNSIEKCNRKTLLGDKDNVVKHRKKKEKESILTMSSEVNDQLLSISRLLADSTQRSADTLTTLVNSSAVIGSTREELENTSSVIAHSKKLLNKYGRRENTDKALVFFAFAFFLACVFYIIQKRLF